MAAQPQRLQRPQARTGRLRVSVATRVKVSIPQVITRWLGACILQKEIGEIPSTDFVLHQSWKCNPFRTVPELFILSRSLRELLSYLRAMERMFSQRLMRLRLRVIGGEIIL